MRRTHAIKAGLICLAALMPGIPALAAGLIRAPAVPQPTAPGDLVGLVLENTLTRAEPPRYITFGTVLAQGQLPKGDGIAAIIGGKAEPSQIDV